MYRGYEGFLTADSDLGLKGTVRHSPLGRFSREPLLPPGGGRGESATGMIQAARGPADSLRIGTSIQLLLYSCPGKLERGHVIATPKVIYNERTGSYASFPSLPVPPAVTSERQTVQSRRRLLCCPVLPAPGSGVTAGPLLGSRDWCGHVQRTRWHPTHSRALVRHPARPRSLADPHAEAKETGNVQRGPGSPSFKASVRQASTPRAAERARGQGQPARAGRREQGPAVLAPP